MKKMKKEVITVRKDEKLLDVIIQTIKSVEEKFSMIYIDNTVIIDKSNLARHKLFKSAYEIECEGGYKIVVYPGENDSKQWWELWLLERPMPYDNYTIFNNLIDYERDLCEGVEVYIKKWGSKTKIDEE